MSKVFGLDEPRSVPASKAIEDAKRLQLAYFSNILAEVASLHSKLVRFLTPTTSFGHVGVSLQISTESNSDSRHTKP